MKGDEPRRLPRGARILVITLRRLGDVLLTTPLVRSLRRGFPGAHLDLLVFRGSEGILAGNPDIDQVLSMSERPSQIETLALLWRLRRRYDLVVSTQAGDRPTFFALAAGTWRVGMLPERGGRGAWWKRQVYQIGVEPQEATHRVTQLLRLARAAGVEPCAELVCPQGVPGAVPTIEPPYAVLHPNPFYAYKRWTHEGWRGLATALRKRGLTVVVTGGPAAGERAYLDRLWEGEGAPIHRLDGRMDWPDLTRLLAGARIYVGADTSMTHLAAASGCPTVALYGPTSPRLIGPWPVGGLDRAWEAQGTIQRRGNVWVVQNPLPCLPCEKLGCDGHLESRAQCLDELSLRQVLVAVDEALVAPRSG
ncbi:MAG: glycosyltransferase family 9 protein [Xanthobacteraceae bacterium]